MRRPRVWTTAAVALVLVIAVLVLAPALYTAIFINLRN
jgi:hypothetical protein